MNQNDFTHPEREEPPFSQQEQRLLHLIDNARIGLVLIDQTHRVVLANQRFADMLGYTLDEVRELHTWDWEAVFNEEGIREDFQDLSHMDFHIDTQHRRKDGTLFDVEVSGTGYNFGGSPKNNAILCFCNDITERIKAQRALMESERRFKSYVENVADILFSIALDGTLRYISPNFESILGYRREELAGDRLYRLLEQDNPDLPEVLHNATVQQSCPLYEILIRYADGHREWYSMNCSHIEDVATGEPLIMGIARNIQSNKEQEERLLYVSTHDQLTDVYNRFFFYDALSRMDRDKQYPLSVLTFDLDDFKMLNDNYGHAAGDAALVLTAKAVARTLRKEDVFARVGGDEFSILLPDTPAPVARRVARRIRASLTDITAHDARPGIVISIGIATKETTDLSLDDLLLTADQAMYRDKQSRREENVDPPT